MFSSFRSPALRARRKSAAPQRSRPPIGLDHIEAAVAAVVSAMSAPPKAEPQREGEARDCPARFNGGGGGFV